MPPTRVDQRGPAASSAKPGVVQHPLEVVHRELAEQPGPAQRRQPDPLEGQHARSTRSGCRSPRPRRAGSGRPAPARRGTRAGAGSVVGGAGWGRPLPGGGAAGAGRAVRQLTPALIASTSFLAPSGGGRRRRSCRRPGRSAPWAPAARRAMAPTSLPWPWVRPQRRKVSGLRRSAAEHLVAVDVGERLLGVDAGLAGVPGGQELLRLCGGALADREAALGGHAEPARVAVAEHVLHEVLRRVGRRRRRARPRS